MNDRLKKIIFDKLYQELKNVEIIPYNDSIFFIDRGDKYWYFEYQKSGSLWWRYDFFSSFFELFSLEMKDYESVISDWVEEVLNCKVNTTIDWSHTAKCLVEEVLNCKVNTTFQSRTNPIHLVEEVLNHKVKTTQFLSIRQFPKVEEVLNCKVNKTVFFGDPKTSVVENILNCEVNEPKENYYHQIQMMENVLSHKNP